MSAPSNGLSMQCNAMVQDQDSSSSASDSDSDCSSDQYQDVPLRLVTRQECDEVDDDSSTSPDEDVPSPRASVRTFPSHCSPPLPLLMPFHARSHSAISQQNSHVDQDTSSLFGGDHNSVIRKGIANGENNE